MVTDEQAEGGLQSLSLEVRQVDMIGTGPETDGFRCHNLSNMVQFLLKFRGVPTGTEILLAHSFVESRQLATVHVEEVFQQRIGSQLPHVQQDIKVQ